jgi:hypothetical protein
MRDLELCEHNGIAITVNPSDGSFSAEVNGCWLRQPTLERLKGLIEENLKVEVKAKKLNLPCVCYFCDDPDSGSYAVELGVIVGLNRKDGALRWRSGDGKGLQFALPDTSENRVLLADLAACENERRRILRIVKPRKLENSRWGSRIEPSAYARQLEMLESRYSAAIREQVPPLPPDGGQTKEGGHNA